MILNTSVHYKHEISLIKYAKPNQEADIVRYNSEFVVTVIVITEFDCNSLKLLKWLFRGLFN